MKGRKAVRARLGSSLRVFIFGLVAFLVAFQDLALPSSLAPRLAHEGTVAVSAAVGVDCAQQNSRSSKDDGRTHDCPLTGICCVAGCHGQTSTDLTEEASSAFAWTEASNGAVGCIALMDRIALTGWASAWSSRAPPRAS